MLAARTITSATVVAVDAALRSAARTRVVLVLAMFEAGACPPARLWIVDMAGQVVLDWLRGAPWLADMLRLAVVARLHVVDWPAHVVWSPCAVWLADLLRLAVDVLLDGAACVLMLACIVPRFSPHRPYRGQFLWSRRIA